MRKKHVIILFDFVFLHFCVPHSFYKKIRHINTENGLFQNTILSIIQDKIGFMCFETKDELNRQEGYSIKIFKHEL